MIAALALPHFFARAKIPPPGLSAQTEQAEKTRPPAHFTSNRDIKFSPDPIDAHRIRRPR
jgi:hypothetical protein